VSPAIGTPVAAPGSTETRRVDGKPPLPKRRTLEWAIAAVALMAVMVAVVFVGGRALGYFGGNAWFPLPNYTQGMTLTEARQALSEKGLVLNSVGYRASSGVPKGQIVDQQPQPGTEVQRGGAVSLTVSTGPPSHRVPDVEGQTSANAIQDLKADGFLYTIRQQLQPPGSQCQQNTVCTQVPAPNVSEKEGTVVTLVVAKGLANVPIPPIAAGTTQTAATLTLAKAGFTNVIQSFQPSQTVKQGLVIGTTPAAGTAEPPGTQVTLIISSGQPVIVPNVLGETQQAATNLLQSEQFSVTPVQATDCNQQANGTVISTNPGPGTSVPTGSGVTIVVAAYDPSSCKTTTTSTSSTTPGNTGNTGNTGTGGGGGKKGRH
jgi:serine/threonine-protein kinase